MKTITEYQPLIFSRLASMAAKRSGNRRRFKTDLMVVAAYSLLGLWLSFDTGFLPWDWQFWIMFAPLLLAGELAFHVKATWKVMPRPTAERE
jgi:hypothetical protein